MSFDVILSSFRDGEPCGIDEERVREAFGQALIIYDSESPSWRLEFGGGDCEVFITRLPDGNGGVSALMVSRPIADERLWNALFQIMRLGHAMLFYLGCPEPLIADEDAAQHIPDYMLQAIGRPVVVRFGGRFPRGGRWYVAAQ